MWHIYMTYVSWTWYPINDSYMKGKHITVSNAKKHTFLLCNNKSSIGIKIMCPVHRGATGPWARHWKSDNYGKCFLGFLGTPPKKKDFSFFFSAFPRKTQSQQSIFLPSKRIFFAKKPKYHFYAYFLFGTTSSPILLFLHFFAKKRRGKKIIIYIYIYIFILSHLFFFCKIFLLQKRKKKKEESFSSFFFLLLCAAKMKKIKKTKRISFFLGALLYFRIAFSLSTKTVFNTLLGGRKKKKGKRKKRRKKKNNFFFYSLGLFSFFFFSMNKNGRKDAASFLKRRHKNTKRKRYNSKNLESSEIKLLKEKVTFDIRRSKKNRSGFISSYVFFLISFLLRGETKTRNLG